MNADDVALTTSCNAAMTWGGEHIYNDSTYFRGNFQWQDASNYALTADTNDVLLPDSTVWSLTPDTAHRNVTGFVNAGAGALRIVYNGSPTYNVVLKHQSASSSAANRIHGWGSADTTLIPGHSVMLIHRTDPATTTRWFVTTPPQNVSGATGATGAAGATGATGATGPATDRAVVGFRFVATSVSNDTWTAVSQYAPFPGTQSGSSQVCVTWQSVGVGCGTNAEARIYNETTAATVATITTSAAAAFAHQSTCGDPAETMPSQGDSLRVHIRYSGSCADVLTLTGDPQWEVIQ